MNDGFENVSEQLSLKFEGVIKAFDAPGVVFFILIWYICYPPRVTNPNPQTCWNLVT